MFAFQIKEISETEFVNVAEKYLQGLCEHLDEVEHPSIDEINYADGVLEVIFNEKNRTFVINKQTPNKQIWLSSPLSGPQRFELSLDDQWLHWKSDEEITQILEKEFNEIIALEGEDPIKL